MTFSPACIAHDFQLINQLSVVVVFMAIFALACFATESVYGTDTFPLLYLSKPSEWSLALVATSCFVCLLSCSNADTVSSLNHSCPQLVVDAYIYICVDDGRHYSRNY